MILERSERTEDEIIFREAVKAILEIMKRLGEIRVYSILVPKIDLAKRFWHLESETKITYPRIPELENEVAKLEPVRKCVSLMLKRDFPKHLEMIITDKDGKPVENPDYEPFLIAEILTLTYRYIELYGPEFNEEKFKELFNEMMEYVYSPTRDLVLVSPLENFELENIDEFTVDEYKVRRLTEWEIKALIRYGYRFGIISTPEYGRLDTIYCVESIIKTSKVITPSFHHYIEDFVTVLRLFKPGIVGFNAILHYPKIWRTSWGASFSHRYQFRQYPKYVFSTGDVQPFTQLWRKYSKLRNQLPKNIKFSLRWFNKAYEEREMLDKLLDLEIALEVLFGTSNRYRLDLYVPHFIGSNKEERLKINKDIRDLWEKRSSIVHSGYSEVTPEFVSRIENIYRLSMQKFLELLPKRSYEDIIEDIKVSILE
ncbi:MAG: HEPN domain-containing protein [Sulfolobales archaeon]